MNATGICDLVKGFDCEVCPFGSLPDDAHCPTFGTHGEAARFLDNYKKRLTAAVEKLKALPDVEGEMRPLCEILEYDNCEGCPFEHMPDEDRPAMCPGFYGPGDAASDLAEAIRNLPGIADRLMTD